MINNHEIKPRPSYTITTHWDKHSGLDCLLKKRKVQMATYFRSIPPDKNLGEFYSVPHMTGSVSPKLVLTQGRTEKGGVTC